MKTTLIILGFSCLAHSLLLILRGPSDVHITFIGMSGSVYPRVGVALVTALCFFWFTILPILIGIALQRGWLATMEIWGKPFAITGTNRATAVRATNVIGCNLVIALASIWIPTRDWRLDHAELGTFFLIGIIGQGFISLRYRTRLGKNRADNEGEPL